MSSAQAIVVVAMRTLRRLKRWPCAGKRDTKDRQRPLLHFTPGAWRRFADRVKSEPAGSSCSCWHPLRHSRGCECPFGMSGVGRRRKITKRYGLPPLPSWGLLEPCLLLHAPHLPPKHYRTSDEGAAASSPAG